jgi:hypothetical protein
MLQACFQPAETTEHVAGRGKRVAIMLIPQAREKHLLFLVETNKSRSLSRMRDRDDIVGALSATC